MGANNFILEGDRLTVHVTLDAGMETDLQKQSDEYMKSAAK